jgi:hypothetical protein
MPILNKGYLHRHNQTCKGNFQDVECLEEFLDSLDKEDSLKDLANNNSHSSLVEVLVDFQEEDNNNKDQINSLDSLDRIHFSKDSSLKGKDSLSNSLDYLHNSSSSFPLKDWVVEDHSKDSSWEDSRDNS